MNKVCYNIKMMMSEKKINPVIYTIKCIRVKRKWWFGYRKEYIIETDYCNIIGFESYNQAYEACVLGNIPWRDIKTDESCL